MTAMRGSLAWSGFQFGFRCKSEFCICCWRTAVTRQQAYDEQLAFTVVGPYLYSKFAFSPQKAKPYDYDALLDDVYFQNLVNVRKVGYEVYTLPVWRRAIQEVEQVISAIDAELERLRLSARPMACAPRNAYRPQAPEPTRSNRTS